MRLWNVVLPLVVAACGGAAPSANDPASGEPARGAVVKPPVDLTGDVGEVAGKLVTVPHGAELLVDAEVLRAHPVGQRVGPLLGALPQWRETLRILGQDPLASHDWVLITGPSLATARGDAIFLRASADEAAVDRALDDLARRSVTPLASPSGNAPSSVRVVPAELDHVPRVALRAHPQLLVVVPSAAAGDTARALTSVRVLPSRKPAEAVRVWMARPHDTVPELPECLAELRARVLVAQGNGADPGGADLFAEGSCGDEASAVAAADRLRRDVGRANNFLVRLATHGLLNGAEVTTEGPMLRAHLHASREQLEATLGAVSAFLGVGAAQASSSIKR
jgi:hypothetical protein